MSLFETDSPTEHDDDTEEVWNPDKIIREQGIENATLKAENAALQEEGRRQWFMAHSGECENLNYGEHTGECTWPMPKILEGKC